MILLSRMKVLKSTNEFLHCAYQLLRGLLHAYELLIYRCSCLHRKRNRIFMKSVPRRRTFSVSYENVEIFWFPEKLLNPFLSSALLYRTKKFLLLGTNSVKRPAFLECDNTISRFVNVEIHNDKMVYNLVIIIKHICIFQ